MTRSGDLVYADSVYSSLNLVIGTKILTLFKLSGWTPLSLCSTSSGELLVIMTSDDYKQTKVVRYSGSTEKQTIQRDDQGNPLFRSAGYLSENRNLDICVAVNAFGTVVVVSAAGKLRFRYTGPPFTTQETLHPAGITADRQVCILISDCVNHNIHIIDQDCNFLRFIDKGALQSLWGLCVDSRNNLFVAERKTRKVKKIQYYNL